MPRMRLLRTDATMHGYCYTRHVDLMLSIAVASMCGDSIAFAHCHSLLLTYRIASQC